ncbi:MAG: hypothetical protein SVY53_05150 [Chloroflexota bacterium]|nr:hypothetical protein [Chloroflexota bacterium]
MKVVINRDYGGFGLSEKAYEELGLEWDGFGYEYFYDRSDPKLVAVVEKLGEEANGRFAKLKVVEIPDDVEWEISDYDGMEIVEEVHRGWY